MVKASLVRCAARPVRLGTSKIALRLKQRSPDQTFEILINDESARTGSLLEDFDPAVNPPAEIGALASRLCCHNADLICA